MDHFIESVEFIPRHSGWLLPMKSTTSPSSSFLFPSPPYLNSLFSIHKCETVFHDLEHVATFMAVVCCMITLLQWWNSARAWDIYCLHILFSSISSNLMVSSSSLQRWIHVIPCIAISLLFITEQYSTLWTYHLGLTICQWIDMLVFPLFGSYELCCHEYVQIFVWTYTFLFLWERERVWVPGREAERGGKEESFFLIFIFKFYFNYFVN